MRHHRDDSPWSASPPGVTQVEYYRRSNAYDENDPVVSGPELPALNTNVEFSVPSMPVEITSHSWQIIPGSGWTVVSETDGGVKLTVRFTAPGPYTIKFNYTQPGEDQQFVKLDILEKLATPDMYATAEEIEMPEYDEVVYWSPPGRRIYFNIRDLDPTATYQWFSGFDRTTVYGTEYSVYTTYSYTYPMYVWCKATKGGQVSDTKVVYMLISDSRPELWKAPQVNSLVRELRKLPLPLQNPQWQATYR